MSQAGAWKPTTFLRFEEALDTSMGTARIVTDAGHCYVKALGNRQGPHPLACEWVATHLAHWFGLPTFDFGVLQIDAEIDEIPFLRGGTAASGPAFVTRAAAGHTWGGSAEELDCLVNCEAISWLMVFDTWTLNCDRHPADLTVRSPNYDNVFLERVSESDPVGFRLIAMDHTHCFTCGRDLGGETANVNKIKDERPYGAFPAFLPRVRQQDVEAAIKRLQELDDDTVRKVVGSIPAEWEVGVAGRKALIELISRRATFVADTILREIGAACWPDKLFDCD